MSDRSAFDSQNIHDAHNIHDSQNTKMVRVSMTKRVCQIGAVSCAVLLGSCAMMTPSRVDDDRLVRLPEDSRAAILKREQAVNVATSNLRAIRTALEEAKRFEGIVNTEVSAATTLQDANERSIKLAEDASDKSSLANAQRAEELSRQRVAMREAKLEYARKLENLRRVQTDEAEAQLALAKAELELTQYQELHKHGMDAGLDGAAFMRTQEQAAARVAEHARQARELRAQVSERQNNWEALRREFDASSRKDGEQMIDAPPPPEPMKEPS